MDDSRQTEIDLDMKSRGEVINSAMLKIQHLMNRVNRSGRIQHKPYKTLASRTRIKNAGRIVRAGADFERKEIKQASDLPMLSP
jgi:hypothetical protein